MCPHQLLAHLCSEELTLRVKYQGTNGPPKLVVQSKGRLTAQLRQLISDHKTSLITLIVSSSMSTLPDWERGIPKVLLPFTCLIECAKRGVVPDGPTYVSRVLFESPNEWILHAVGIISQMENQEPSEVNQRKIDRAIVILQDLEDWMTDSMWENDL